MDAGETKRAAEDYARKNKKRLARSLTDISKYAPDNAPISVFMAGSPGAGKTEMSRRLIEIVEKDKRHQILRIDGDELRQYLPGYKGANSHLFQTAISILVEAIHDSALAKSQTFVLDGTLSKYEKAVLNIKRSLSKGRNVFVFYVYQRPEVAWAFTKAREAVEGRNIPKDAFIRQFIESRETIERIRSNFDARVGIFLVRKNFETHAVEDVVSLPAEMRSLDQYLDHRYTKSELQTLL